MSINIGNNNKINKSNIIEGGNTPQKKDSLWKIISINIMSNFIWWIIGIIVSGLGITAIVTNLIK